MKPFLDDDDDDDDDDYIFLNACILSSFLFRVILRYYFIPFEPPLTG